MARLVERVSSSLARAVRDQPAVPAGDVAGQPRDGRVRPDRAHLGARVLESAEPARARPTHRVRYRELYFHVCHRWHRRRPVQRAHQAALRSGERRRKAGAVASVPSHGPVVAVCVVRDVVFPALEPDLSRNSLHGHRGHRVRHLSPGSEGKGARRWHRVPDPLRDVHAGAGVVHARLHPAGVESACVERRTDRRNSARRTAIRLQFRLVLGRCVRAFYVEHERRSLMEAYV